MKKICLALLISVALLPSAPVFAQESADEIKSQIESLQKVLDEMLEDETLSTTTTNSTRKTKIDKTDWGKRSAPVPLGEFFAVTDTAYGDDGNFQVELNFKIATVVRGVEAFDTLMAENQFNKPAPEGLEWAIFNLEAEYLKGSEDYPYTPYLRLNIYDTSGKQVDQTEWATLSAFFSDTNIFPGVTHTGREAYLVPEGEDFLISIDFEKLYFFDSK